MAMDAGLAGILGAAIGASASLAGIPLTHWVQQRKASSLAEKRRARLRGMLSGKRYTWRSLESLAASIGADPQTTMELLIEIDARASFSNSNSWALVSRAPWPDDLQPVEG
ncbi:MAG: hypothetical protein SXU28_13340 [Pseudomonadota bacterium]|nr:hypothetical protein [Pseudomonadota bacterium]